MFIPMRCRNTRKNWKLFKTNDKKIYTDKHSILRQQRVQFSYTLVIEFRGIPRFIENTRHTSKEIFTEREFIRTVFPPKCISLMVSTSFQKIPLIMEEVTFSFWYCFVVCTFVER